MASSDQGIGRMQFILECGGRCGPRVGKLIWTTPKSLPAAAPPLATPLCFLYSRGGAIPNLTRDLEEDVVRHVTGNEVTTEEAGPAIMLTMPTMYTNGYQVLSADVLNEYQKGIHAFLNRESQLLYLSVQDPANPADYRFNDTKTVSIWTMRGRSKVAVSDHVRLLRAYRPNVFECLYDSAPARENKMKRINKSVDRTLRFLDETIMAVQEHKDLQSCSLLGAIVGSDVMSERLRSARETAARPTDGFVLKGLDCDEESSHDSMKELLVSVNQCLPESKPRFVHGLYKPEDILCAVEYGVDVFEASYAHKATEKGRAVVFPRGQTTALETAGSVKLKYEESRPFEIDLNDEKYAADFSPFLPGCGCYACRHHTRAYTHHLLNTNEILAKILLAMHNLSHYSSFFADLRDALQKSSFQKFKNHCLH